MFIPTDTLCPMAFNNTAYRRDSSPCLGEMCGWFVLEQKQCAVKLIANKAVEAPVAEAPVVEAPVVEAPVVEAPVVEAEKPKKSKAKAAKVEG